MSLFTTPSIPRRREGGEAKFPTQRNRTSQLQQAILAAAAPRKTLGWNQITMRSGDPNFNKLGPFNPGLPYGGRTPASDPFGQRQFGNGNIRNPISKVFPYSNPRNERGFWGRDIYNYAW